MLHASSSPKQLAAAAQHWSPSSAAAWARISKGAPAAPAGLREQTSSSASPSDSSMAAVPPPPSEMLPPPNDTLMAGESAVSFTGEPKPVAPAGAGDAAAACCEKACAARTRGHSQFIGFLGAGAQQDCFRRLMDWPQKPWQALPKQSLIRRQWRRCIPAPQR